MSLEIGAGGPAEESSFREKRRTHFVRMKSVRVICRTNIRHIHDPLYWIYYTGNVFSRDVIEQLTTRVVSSTIGVRHYLDDRCL